MLRLLSIEFQKILKNKASKILLITYFVLLSFIALFVSLEFEFGDFKFRIADQGIFNFPYIWHFNTFIANFFKLFLAIIIVSLITNEYSYGTLKQNLIDGLSKREFIFSKFYVTFILALASTLFLFILSLILGYSFSSYTEASIVFSDLEYLIAYFLKLMFFFSLCLFFGMLVKRSAFALGFLLILFLFEFFFYWGLSEFITTKEIATSIANFLPFHASWNLIHEPMTRFTAIQTLETTISGQIIERDYSVPVANILITTGWIFICNFGAYKLLQKRDL